QTVPTSPLPIPPSMLPSFHHSRRRSMDKQFFWQSRPWQAFKNFAIIFSFIVNIILVVVLLLAVPLLLPGVNAIARPLVSGLSDSFVQMGEASIVRTINVDDEIPVVFSLPLQQQTQVVLTEPEPMS